MSGDALARGARSATFGPAKVSQEKWDAIWDDEDKPPKIEYYSKESIVTAKKVLNEGAALAKASRKNKCQRSR